MAQRNTRGQTSARSTGRANPTSSQKRPARAKESTAKTTTARTRGTGSSSTRVTTGSGGQRPRGGAKVTQTPKALLPPGRPGGALATRSRGGALATRSRGGALAKTATRGGTKAAATAVARSVPKGAGRFLGPLGLGLAAADQITQIANPNDPSNRVIGQAINRVRGGGGGQQTQRSARQIPLTTEQQQRNRQADINRAQVRQGRGGGAPAPAAPTAGGGGGGGRQSAPAPVAERRRGGGGGGRPAPAAPAAPSRQSASMDENYATWARANPKLAAKVKKGQAGYEAIQKTINPAPKPQEQPQQQSAPAQAGNEENPYLSNTTSAGRLAIAKPPQWLQDMKKRKSSFDNVKY